MGPETPTRHAGRPYASMAPDGQASWSLSGNHSGLQIQQRLSNNHLDVSPIDPQLSSSNPSRESVSHPSRQPDSSTIDLSPAKTSRQYSDASTFSSSEIVDRVLPSCDVSDDTFDDAYVAFIFYCNPAIPLDTDTLELRRAFRSPPKRKLEMKEIKTWAQLAIDLGVEPPAVDKGQSAQKVQQYAVRLKVIIL
jgi:ARS binding protein 2